MMSGYDYNKIDEGYYDEVFKRQKGVQSKWHHLKFKGVVEQLKLISAKNILDIGCGAGTFHSIIKGKYEYCGVDFSYKQIKHAQSHNEDKKTFFIVSSGEKLPFKDNFFDTIVAIEFIEHLEKVATENLIREIKRCLKPGGKLILTTPNYLSFWPLLEILVGLLSKVSYKEQHVLKFNAVNLKTFLKDFFSEVKVRPYLFSAPFIAIVNWQFADKVFSFENKNCYWLGNLLMATATKN